MMKTIVAAIFLAVFASPLFAQDDAAAARAAAGCGPGPDQVRVKTDKNQHPAPKGGKPTKALVYVFQDVKQDNTLTIGHCHDQGRSRWRLDWGNPRQVIFFLFSEPGIIACVQPGNPASRESPNWVRLPI